MNNPDRRALDNYFEAVRERISAIEKEIDALRADSLRFKGRWGGPAAPYRKGDVVHHRAASWVCAEEGATAEPGSGKGWWSLTAE